jgi:predicted phosphodiesterase
MPLPASYDGVPASVNRFFVLIVALLTLLTPLIHLSCRHGFVFINHFTLRNLSEILFIVQLIICSYLLIFLYFSFVSPLGLGFQVLFYICLPFTLFFVIGECYFIRRVRPRLLVYPLLHNLQYFLSFIFVYYLFFFHPLISDSVRPGLSLGLFLFVIIFIAIYKFYWPFFRFLTNPLVLDNGEGFTILWATNLPAIGFVTYTYGNQSFTIYGQTEGKPDISTIQRVRVPYDHITNNNYCIHSTRVIDERSYGGVKGKTIHSIMYQFRGDSCRTIISASDWHEGPDPLVECAKHFPRPDLVILLGDGSDLNFDRDIIEFLIAPGAKITQSECPAIYARGNHDCRGLAAHNLAYKLGLSSLYYQCARDGILFTVLDTGEDKSDDNWEYAGFAHWAQYNQEQEIWLANLTQPNARFIPGHFRLRICVAHIGDLSDYDQEIKQRWKQILEQMGTDGLIVGHSHQVRHTPKGERPYVFMMDGGCGINNSFNGICLTIDGTSYRCVGQDKQGNVVLDASGVFG